MKYSEANKPLVCMQTQSTCYKGTRTMTPVGVLWHSTGANNPNIKRYVQPSDNAADKDKMLALLGINVNKNDWNHIDHQAGLNCWIGKLADGTVTTVQTMPWNFRPWGCGSGSRGSCNSGWIQFEICEDALIDADYFNKAYKEACEITAYLCKMFNINPNGTVDVGGVKIPTILCHQDSYKLGMGSNHGDIYNWFPKFGKNMDNVRADVAALIAGASTQAPTSTTPTTPAQSDVDDAFYKNFVASMTKYRKSLQDNDSGKWSAAARTFVTEIGLFAGSGKLPNGEPNMMWEDFITREQIAQVLYRLCDMIANGKLTSTEAIQALQHAASVLAG